MTDEMIRRGDAERIVLAYANPESAEKAHNAIRALPAVRVGVKPLVWVDFEGRGAKAQAWDCANYLIQKWSDGRWEVSASYPGYSTSIEGLERFHPTLEAAKAAAQADYEARILDALEPQPVAADPIYSAAVTASDFLDVAVSKCPEPLKVLGAWLANNLDEDKWPTAERCLNAAAITPQPVTLAAAMALPEVRALVDTLKAFADDRNWYDCEEGNPAWCLDVEPEELARTALAPFQAKEGGE